MNAPSRGASADSLAPPIVEHEPTASAEPFPNPGEVPDLPALPPLEDDPTLGAQMGSPGEGYASGPNLATGAPPQQVAADPPGGAATGLPGPEPQSVLPTPPFAMGPSSGSGTSSSLFSTAWLEVQSALDRGDLSQALLKLSDWYGDPSLSPDQSREVETLLAQLAGSVIYEGPPVASFGGPLSRRGRRYADADRRKIRRALATTCQDQRHCRTPTAAPGQELKVVRGPFSAIVDLSERQLTLMLDRRYAGRFPIDIAAADHARRRAMEGGPKAADAERSRVSTARWPAPSEDRSLILSNLTFAGSEPAVLRGPGNADPAAIQPRGSGDPSRHVTASTTYSTSFRWVRGSLSGADSTIEFELGDLASLRQIELFDRNVSVCVIPERPPTMYDKQALQDLMRDKALKFGEFTLASGKQASYYLDCRQVTLSADGARLIGAGMLELLADEMPPLVGGMAIGADPITAAILTLAGIEGLPLRGIMVRKEPKQHGTGKFVEGPYEPGEEVVIVEDVVTTGGSSLLAIERCEAVGTQSSARAGDHRSPGRRARSLCQRGATD